MKNNNNMHVVDRGGVGGRREKGRKLVNLELSEPHQGPYIKDDEVLNRGTIRCIWHYSKTRQ